MASTSATTYASTIQTIYLKKLLATAKGYLVSDKFATQKPIGKGEGDTVRFNKILRPSKQTAAITPGTMVAGDSSGVKALSTNYKEFSLEQWEDYFAFDKILDVTSFIKDSDNRDTVARQMAQSLDKAYMNKLATQGMRWRIDKDTTYQVNGTCTSTSSATSAVGPFTTTSDDKNGGYATVYNAEGPNYDITSAITDSTEASAVDTLAVSFPQALTASSKLHVVVGTGIVTTDVLTTTGILDVVARHEFLETETFDDGMFYAFFHSAQHRDLWDDTTFVNSAIYDNSGRFKTYKVGRWFDVEFLVSSNIRREDADGTANDSGAVYVSPILGKNSHAIASFANPGGMGNFAVNFHVIDKPDSYNISLAKKWLVWQSMWAGGVTRATSVINLMTGATALGMDG